MKVNILFKNNILTQTKNRKLTIWILIIKIKIV